MQPEAVLLIIFALTLWLLGVVSDLMLPIIVQKASEAWQQTAGTDADSVSDESSMLQPGLQSRPISDVDADEVLDDDLLLDSSDLQLPHHLLAASGGLSPTWHVTWHATLGFYGLKLLWLHVHR